MWKNIACDHFRGGFKKMRKTDGMAFAAMIYPLIILFSRMRWKEMIVCLLVYLPMLYILFSVCKHPVELSKMMYLCPMEVDGRRQYIRSSYHFRIFVNMSVAVIWAGILMLFYDCDMIAVTEILLNDLVLSLLIPLERRSDEMYGSIHKESARMCCMIVVSMLSNLVLTLTVTDKDAGYVITGIVFVCIVLVQMPLVITYQKYVRGELEAAVYYENL